MRLNSSKQAQAPEEARPLKNLPCGYVHQGAHLGYVFNTPVAKTQWHHHSWQLYVGLYGLLQHDMHTVVAG
jgi:hypothetical protein